jgi:hypothetical protein
LHTFVRARAMHLRIRGKECESTTSSTRHRNCFHCTGAPVFFQHFRHEGLVSNVAVQRWPPEL